MSDKTTLNRETMIRVATLVRPALAAQAYIPALTHIRFDGAYATTYNYITAIAVRAKVELSACLPGELLLKTLNSFGAESVMIQEVGESAVVISSGRSKIKLPVLTTSAFPFDKPSPKDDAIPIDASIMKGIERCLLSVGNDPTHPAQMGVTLDIDEKGHAVLFSTDNFTISRYQTKSKIELPGDSPVILPTFFCQQLVALAKAFPEEELDLFLVSGGLLVHLGKQAYLFSKTMVDLEPLDFPKIVERNVKLAGIKDRASKIPDQWDGAFGRALLVLSGEVDKITKVTVSDEGIRLRSTSAMGDSDDTMGFDGAAVDAFHVDPTLIARSSKSCSLVEFRERVVVMADDECQFVHLIAHCSSK